MRVLVETDFLFGLSVKDKLHTSVLRLLEKARRGEVELFVSSAAVLEAMLVMMSKGLSYEAACEALELMHLKLTEYGVGYASLTPLQVSQALRLRQACQCLTLFDALHAATALEGSYVLVSSDKLLRRVVIEHGGSARDYSEI